MSGPLDLGHRDGVGIHQRRKLFELRNAYTLTDATGEAIGRVTQERQSGVAKALRVLSDLDLALPMELDVVDTSGAEVLTITKPAMTWRCAVTATDGPVGTITKKVRLGKARFVLADADGASAGEVQATGWRAREFDVLDAQGSTMARVTKAWRGLMTEAVTDADSYAIEFAPHATATQRTLALASALAIDVVMKQKDS